MKRPISSFISSFAFLLIMSGACKEAYDPSVEESIASFLIVEGFINTKGVTSIQLSRTQKLREKGLIKFENGAMLQIQNDNGGSFPLLAKGNGLYESSALDLPTDREYRLRIVTSAGREYLSDYVPVRVSQPVKSSWGLTADGAQILVSSEDPTGQTVYHQWTYEEVWELNSERHAVLKTYGPAYRVVGDRDPVEIPKLYQCWSTVRATRIMTASTKGLSTDKIENYKLISIPNGSDKLSVRYSVLVKQLAITREAYDFYELMGKSSEQLGSIFDPQPNMVRGNIRSTDDSSEPVVGYIRAGAPSESRMFITSSEAGNWKWSMVCDMRIVENHPDSIFKYHYQDKYIPVRGEPNPKEPILYAYFYSHLGVCIDCRLRGSNIRPTFW